MARPKNSDTVLGQQLQAAKFQRILEAALEVFAEKGFHAAKISEIAKRADVGDGTIYLYFKNKDDLLISLFETKLEAITRGLKQELQNITDVSESLRHVIRYHLRLAIENPTLTAFMTIELRSSAKFVKDYAKAQFLDYLDQWAEIIKKGQQQGLFDKNIRVGVFTHILFGALDQICLTWVNNPQKRTEDLQQIGEQLIAMMLKSLKK